MNKILKRLQLVLLLGLGLGLSACGEQASSVDPADMVIRGGTIYTANDTAPTAEAVAVKNGRIIYVGDGAGVDAFMAPSTQLYDLGGAAMYPGFTDAHGHLLGIGFRELNLNLEDIPSIAAMVEIVAARVGEAADGQWISGRGWIETHYPEDRFPNRHDLDAVSPNNPVFLGRSDGHASVANSAALALAGITGATEPPSGGDILKDENGEPTGMLIDAAQGLVRRLLDEPSAEDKARAFAVASDVYAAYGWTNIHTMSTPYSNVPMIEALSDAGKIDLRVYVSAHGLGDEIWQLIENGPRSSANGHVVTRAIKLYMDGALGSRGAALLEPYSDAPTSGLTMMEKDAIMPLMEAALGAGIQVNTHAIGDRGNRMLLDWYEQAFNDVPVERRAVAEPRWRDEHTQIVDPNDIGRFAALGIIPSMQPSHAIGDLYFAPARLGDARLHGAYAWRSLIDAGSIIAGGSDAPVERGDPRIEFYAAVARKSLDGFSNEDWHPEEVVSRAEALKMFTLWPAYAAFQENDLGSIEVGKYADFTVFAGDIMTMDEADILNVDVVMTMVEGEPIYQRSGGE
jgi:predicted amidohydrolase YtcJ